MQTELISWRQKFSFNNSKSFTLIALFSRAIRM